MSTLELFRRYPQTRELPHVELANLPTAVKPLAGANEELGLTGLAIKCDDQTSDLYGGNKVRKLEFLLGDALEGGHEEVWTVGTIGSHHVLATCIWARELGLECGAIHFPQPLNGHVRKNMLALSTTHPKIELLTTEFELTKELFARKMEQWRGQHPDTYYIPAGGTTPLGAIGYVNAALEFARQVEEGEAERPDRIYVAAGTCGTFAGLLLGFAMAEFDVEVVGVRVSALFLANEARVASLITRMTALLESVGVEDIPSVEPEQITMNHDEFGRGYGYSTVEGLHARDLLDRTDHLHLEPTYTAKAFAAIIADRRELAEREARVLYWHTLNGADLQARVDAADLDAFPDEYRHWIESDIEGVPE